MPSNSVHIDEGVWIKVLPSGRSGSIRYVYGVGDVYLTQARLQPTIEPPHMNPIMEVLQPEDLREFNDLILESIWAYSPKNSSTFIVTPLEVDPPIAPVVVEDPSDYTYTVGSPTGVHASAVDWETLEWYFDDVATGVVTDRYTPVIESNTSHEVYAKFTNVTGSVDTGRATISPDVRYPIITVQPTPQTVAIGGTLTLVSNGTNFVNSEWFANGSAIGGTPPTLILYNVIPSNAGEYYCQYENDFGVTRTNKVLVTIT